MSQPADAIPAPGDADALAWRRPALIIAVVALVASAVGFGWTLGGNFLADDFGYISRFYEYPLSRWPRLFVQGWAGDMWGFQLRELRPVTALSFMTDARVWGGNAFGFRLTNFALHGACGALAGLIAWRAASRDLACGLAAAALFALHPAHAEAVQWITGRVDVLATTLYLAGCLAFLRYRATGGRGWAVAIAAIYAGAAFAKEFGLTLPLMFLMADTIWLQRWRQWRSASTWWPYAGCLVVVMIYFFCRRAAFGSDGMGAALPPLTNVDFHRNFAERQLTYLGHLFPPLERWWQEGTPLFKAHAVRTFLCVAGGVAAGFATWLFAARHRPVEERRAAVCFGVGWYLVATLPLVVTYVSARHLYLASAGVCIALAVILRGLLRLKLVFAMVAVAVAAFSLNRLVEAMRPWNVAAVMSGKISREVRALEREVQAGGALFLDVPEIRDKAYVWTWAVPFAVRPPFTRTPLNERMVVLESHGLYFDNARWLEQPAIAALQRVEGESWVIQLLNDQPLRRIRVSPERVRAAAGHFAAEPLQKFPHESWRKLINELTER